MLPPFDPKELNAMAESLCNLFRDIASFFRRQYAIWVVSS